MATYSTVLGLKLSGESDPFLLSDFIQNWQLLDSSPGIFICTSATRPSWGANQDGRLIFMTDLKQLSYWESVFGWHDLRDSSPVYAGGSYLNVACNPGSSGVFNILTFTTPRPSALAVWLSGTYNYPNNKTQDGWQSVTFDGVQQTIGSYREQVRFAGNAADAGNAAGVNATSLAVIPSVSAGQHRIGVQVDVSSSYKTAITLVGVKAIAMISLYSSANAL